MATMKDIAKVSNVSIATVSNIINNKPGASKDTKDRVLKVIEEMNYTPNYTAKNLKQKNMRTIGVLAEDMTAFSNPHIIDGITEQMEEKNYNILLVNLRLYKKYDSELYTKKECITLVEQKIKELLGKQVDGIIYVSAYERINKYIPKNLGIPIVMAYGCSESDKIPSVRADNSAGASDAVNYMIKKGHKKIGIISGELESIYAQERLIGYQKALKQNLIPYNPNLLCIGNWYRETGYRYTDYLLGQNVTAVFCMNDLMAGGVYDRLNELGKQIGEDISVTGFENHEVSAYYNPPLTTIALPLYEIGSLASKIMIQMLNKNNENLKEKYMAACSLIPRKSVCKLV